MKNALVLDGRIMAVFEEDQVPLSYKGKLLPVVEVVEPAPKDGSKWQSVYEAFSDRVEQKWIAVALTTEEQAQLEEVVETSRLRAMMDALRAGQGTVGERLARLERVVAHLCRITLKL